MTATLPAPADADVLVGELLYDRSGPCGPGRCVCRTLPATRTHKSFGARRAYFWQLPGSELTGLMEVVQGQDEPGVYLVDEDVSEPFPGRKWLLAKQNGEADVYEVSVRAGQWRCTCKGWVCWGGQYSCCHCHAVRALCDAGDLG